MPLKKYLVWAGLAFAVFSLVRSPSGAAGMVREAATGLGAAADSLSRFVDGLAS